MRSKKRTTCLVVLVVVVASLLVFEQVYVRPMIAARVSTDVDAFRTTVASTLNYPAHTSPLPENVQRDVCSKLQMERNSKACAPGAAVYAPDFFPDIKSHFGNLPKQDRTVRAVENAFGAYLVDCEAPIDDGSFRCFYDLVGDGVYPFAFRFDRNGFIDQIFAEADGS